MRDFASCFTEHAVRVSDSSCSGSTTGRIAATGGPADPSVQTTVSSLYRTKLSNLNHLLINVTWSKTHTGPKSSIVVDDGRKSTQFILRDRSGRQTSALIGLYWDFSSAKYGTGSKPVDGFYVAVTFNSELVLLLGEMPMKIQPVPAESLLISRREQVLGCANYSTRSCFRSGGAEHDITIRWGNATGSELTVCVDNKRVVHVRRLEYNFRGNQTLFVDGLPVDLMWDVHGWWFGGDPAGLAVFMFRARSTLESRLWLEEVMLSKEKREAGFSLVIQACKGEMKIVDW